MIPSFVPTPVEPLPDAVVYEFEAVSSEYLSARAAVVETAEEHVAARERCSDLRERYVELHARLLKGGAEPGPRLMPGTLPGQTAQEGLRSRWLIALGRRW